jgi:alpha-glucosidase
MRSNLIHKRNFCRSGLFKLYVVAALSFSANSAFADSTTAAIKRLNPPQMGFYAKEIDYQGIPIKTSNVVADQALLEAWRRLKMMLEHIPDAASNLHEHGAELHIIGKGQGTTDLPEHRAEKGKLFDRNLTMDERTRGVGGVFASCGEENLLRLRDDRYHGRDICVHEFAHTLQELGLDEALQNRIKDRYEKAIGSGLWKTTYAATNDGEFFAELSMWYFGTHGDEGEIQPPPQPGKEWLRQYDPDSYALLDDIYSGRLHIDKLHFGQLRAFSPTLEGHVYSGKQPGQTAILFVNRSGQELSAYWLDYSGARHFYAAIPAYSQVLQHTYVSHVWLVTRKSGQGVAIFQATPEPAKAIVP